MGDVNQFTWVSGNRDLLSGPVLEIGSRHYNPESSEDYRSLCDGLGYVGVDLSAGDNVDLVLDVTRPFEEVAAALGGRTFGTVICCSVLEHVEDVSAMAANIDRLVAPGGRLFVSVPFSWRFHGYPSDYWRFTPQAVRTLFRGFDFDDERSSISSNLAGDVRPLAGDPNDFMVREPVGLVRAPGLLGRLAKPRTEYKYVLLPTMINMLGTKKPS